MSTAALLLAAAMLLGATPKAVRHRTGSSVKQPVIRRTPTRHDPFATASSLDVLAVCLSAGMDVAHAAITTAGSAPPPLSAALQRAADLLTLGADPDSVWVAPADASGLEGLMRLARRSASSGTALAQGVSDLAAQQREEIADSAQAAAGRAAVLIAGPLGLCFLPAFICLGIVPVIAGLAGDVIGTGVL